MPRRLSEALLIDIFKEGNDSLGSALGRILAKSGICVIHVEKALNVSKMTLHAWLRGGQIREKNKRLIEAFMRLVDADLKSGVLPVGTIAESKKYVEDMVGHKI